MKLEELAGLDITPYIFYVFNEKGQKVFEDFRGNVKYHKIKNAEIVKVETNGNAFFIDIKEPE